MTRRWWRYQYEVVIGALVLAVAAGLFLWLTTPPTVTAERCDPAPRVTSRHLIVLVPGFTHTTALWGDMRQRLAAAIPDFAGAQWLCIDHHHQFWSRGRADDVAHSVRDLIDVEWAKAGRYDEIVLIGHSLGGLLVRQAYLLAAGADNTETVTVPWASKVRRIILFAAVNRGADVDAWGWHWRISAWLLDQLPVYFVALDVRRGSEFIANLRINWMRYFRKMEERTAGESPPRIVQFLGDRDGIVKRDDSKDVLAFKNGRYFEIPGAGHADLFRLEPRYTGDPDGRLALIRHGILDPASPLAASGRTAEPQVDQVVFVLHGIRALTSADWLSGLGREIEVLDRTRTRVGPAAGSGGATLVIHPEYGWLTAVHFAIPFYRQRYLAWFADRFAEARVQYPDATFFAVAHSNGTYILGQNLRRLSGMEFKRIVLAGSVLPVDFPWDELRARRQVSEVRNYRANHDWPVGLLCAGLRALGFTDVGTGGFDGFYGSTVKEVAYLTGLHDAAFNSPSRRQDVIRYLLLGEDKPIAKADHAKDPSVFRALSHFMWYVAWGLVVGVFVVGVLVWRSGQKRWRRLYTAVGILAAVYIVLDII